jgi:Uma2 family endonuclease
MAFVIDDAYLPATLTAQPMTDEEFAAFCAEHPDLFFEMTAECQIIVMPPAYSFTGARNSRINRQLDAWAELDGRGIACDSSTGFVLSNGVARRSPDGSWTLKSRVTGLAPANRNRYWHLCPDFVIELRSSSDRLRSLKEKMEEYIASGAQLGWLIDPEARSVSVYRAGGTVETLTQIDSMAGEGPVAGFNLDLTFIWNPYGSE